MGRAIAKRFVSEGASVVVVDRYIDKAQETTADLGAAAVPFKGDVTIESEMEAAISLAVELFQKVDIAVNAAGVGITAALVDQTLEQWRLVQDINLTGVFISCKYEAQQMQRQSEGGVIVNIASTNAVQPGEGLSAYCASRLALPCLQESRPWNLRKITSES